MSRNGGVLRLTSERADRGARRVRRLRHAVHADDEYAARERGSTPSRTGRRKTKNDIGSMKRFDQEPQEAGDLVGAEGLASPGDAPHCPGRARTECRRSPTARSPRRRSSWRATGSADVETPEQAYDIAARASAAPGPGGRPMNMPIEVREATSRAARGGVYRVSTGRIGAGERVRGGVSV